MLYLNYNIDLSKVNFRLFKVVKIIKKLSRKPHIKETKKKPTKNSFDFFCAISILYYFIPIYGLFSKLNEN